MLGVNTKSHNRYIALRKGTWQRDFLPCDFFMTGSSQLFIGMLKAFRISCGYFKASLDVYRLELMLLVSLGGRGGGLFDEPRIFVAWS